MEENGYMWYLPVVMPQLAVAGNQVDPLAHWCLFFFKRKNVHSLQKLKLKMSGLPSHTECKLHSAELWGSSDGLYLFAALSETDGHVLTRKELPDRGGLAWPKSRFVACRQGMLLEGLSKLLNLL